MKLKSLAIVFAVLFVCGTAFGTTISLSISGKGAINDSTIAAGEPVSLDLYFENERVHRGFTMGFKMVSDDIKKIVHVSDSGNGVNPNGDFKAYNGWQDKSIWDMNGIYLVECDWNGILPDTIGLGGICVKQSYKPHEKKKCLSFDIMVPTTGTFVFDSCFFPPSGIWVLVGDDNEGYPPIWGGPFKISVVSKAAAEKLRAPKATEAKKEGK